MDQLGLALDDLAEPSVSAAPVERLRSVLQRGLAWLDGEQPKGALLEHHGIYFGVNSPYPRAAGAYLQIIINAQRRRAVVVFHHGWELFKQSSSAEVALLERRERRLVAVLNGLSPVAETWPSNRCVSARLEKSPGADILRIVADYHLGCPRHRPMFCGDLMLAERNQRGEPVQRLAAAACRWFARGRALARLPEGWS